MVEQLQQEVQTLRGIVEEQSHQIKLLKQQGRDRYRDLDQRLLQLKQLPSSNSESSSAPAKEKASTALPQTTSKVVDSGSMPSSTAGGAGEDVVSPAAPIETAPSAKQQRAYQQAYDLIKQKKYDQAVDQLHKFIELYPNSDLTGNAYYWLGEVYLVMPKFEQARQAFTVVVGSFSTHRKAADAMFKLGVTYHRLDKLEDAKFYLAEVVKRYPESSAAKLAKEYSAKL